MINDIENKVEMYNRSHRYHINTPTPRHKHKYTKYKMYLVVKM